MILRFVCTLTFISIASGIAFCQALQIRAGVNYSTMSGWRDMKAHGGFYAGIQKDISLGDHGVSFQPGIFYSLQTTQYNPPSTVNTTQKRFIRYTLHYVQMPVMFNFEIGKHFGLLAGAQAGLLAHAERKINDGKTTTKEPLTTRFNSLAFSLGIGSYYKIDDFKIELRLLQDVFSTDGGGDGHMFLMQFGFAYTLNKKESK